MGETAADTRRELEETREQLGADIRQLRSRTGRLRELGIRVAVGAGALAAVGATVAVGVVVVRRRRGGRLTAAARSLPSPAKSRALPVARRADRWAGARAERAREQREELVELIVARVAEQQARAGRAANPLWRRTMAKGLETAAAVGTAALVRRAIGEMTMPKKVSTEDPLQAERDHDRELVRSAAAS